MPGQQFRLLGQFGLRKEGAARHVVCRRVCYRFIAGRDGCGRAVGQGLPRRLSFPDSQHDHDRDRNRGPQGKPKGPAPDATMGRRGWRRQIEEGVVADGLYDPAAKALGVRRGGRMPPGPLPQQVIQRIVMLVFHTSRCLSRHFLSCLRALCMRQ